MRRAVETFPIAPCSLQLLINEGYTFIMNLSEQKLHEILDYIIAMPILNAALSFDCKFTNNKPLHLKEPEWNVVTEEYFLK